MLFPASLGVGWRAHALRFRLPGGFNQGDLLRAGQSLSGIIGSGVRIFQFFRECAQNFWPGWVTYSSNTLSQPAGMVGCLLLITKGSNVVLVDLTDRSAHNNVGAAVALCAGSE